MDNFFKVIVKSKKCIIETIESQEKRRDIQLELNIFDDILPVEYFMKIPSRMKSHKFYQDIKTGDVVIGCVTRIYQNRIEVNLTCTMGALLRDITALKITAICRANELPVVSNFSSTKAFRCGDMIKAIITKITRNESLEISMNELSSMNNLRQTDLGLISEENLPSYFKICQEYSSDQCYFNDAFPPNELSTSIDIKNKLEYYNISNSGFSLLDDINGIKIPENETAKNMRSALLLKESMKYVVKGVNYYKLKQLNEALQCYNHALSINEANVDALVARGALRASSKAFALSIEDLEKAVKIDPNHKNAALYLSQTIVAYSRSLPENERMIAEDLVKTTIMSRDDKQSKHISNNINDPNQFIIITDEDSSDSSKSSKSHKKHKNKRTKKRKSKTSQKAVTIDSSSSEDRKQHPRHHFVSIDSSSDSDVRNRAGMSSVDSNKRKRKHSKDDVHSKQMKSMRRSSSSDYNRSFKSRDKSLNRCKQSLDRFSHKPENKNNISSSSFLQSWKNVPVSSAYKHKSRRSSSSESSIGSSSHGKLVGKLPRYLNHSFKDNMDAQSWSINNNNNNHTASGRYNIQKTTLDTMKDHDTKDEHNTTIPDIVVSCDRENLKLKKANEDIKQIEDFISSLRQSVPL